MTAPSVTILIPTYARTALLREAVESVLRLRYEGPLHVNIYNDCPQQNLAFTPTRSLVEKGMCISSMSFFNERRREPSLAAKRQTMLSKVKTDYLCFLDDDDLMMPWFLNSLAMVPGKPLYLPKQQFKVTGGNWMIEDVPGGLFFIVRRDIALSVGFHSGLNIGEDNAFRNAVLAKCKGDVWVDPAPGYVYRCDIVGGMHISRALDHKAQFSEHDYLKSVRKRMDEGSEPMGPVSVVPAWREDYEKKARQLMEML